MTKYGPVYSNNVPMLCDYSSFGAPSTATGASWRCTCGGTQPQCNAKDGYGGDQLLYAANWTLPSLSAAVPDPWYFQTYDAAHRTGSTIYHGDVYNAPDGAAYISGFPGFSHADPTFPGLADNVGIYGGNYMIAEGYVYFPAYAESVQLRINFNGRETFGSIHLSVADGSYSRNPNDWKMILKKKTLQTGVVTYDSLAPTGGYYTVPSCAFGKWASFAAVVSDGSTAYGMTLEWNMVTTSGVSTGWVMMPANLFSSTKVNPVDADCRTMVSTSTCLKYVPPSCTQCLATTASSPPPPQTSRLFPVSSFLLPILLPQHLFLILVTEESYAPFALGLR